MKKILAGVGVVILLLLVAGLVAGWWLAGRGRAQRDGSARLPGLGAEVEVRWDRWGVPHLKGGSAADLAAALGYLHAGDRMAQMELGRRLAAGRLSEVVGRAALEVDRHSRTLRLRATAQRQWQETGEESRTWLTAYALGVNAWLDGHRGDLPPTLTLLGIDPEPWSPVDSLSFALLMAEDLSFWQGMPEEVRFEWLARLGPERLGELLGAPALEVPAEILALARETAATLPAAGGGADTGGEAPGSNNWAVGLSRSAEGLPLVANDPHLGFRLPGTWYEVHLRAPDLELAGLTLPGLPGVVIGENADLAWALTNVMMDDHDLFFERLDPAGTRVLRGEEWVPLAVERVEIGIKGGGSESLELVTSDRGPVLPADAERGLPARSLAWTPYLGGDPFSAFLALARARRVEEVPAGIGRYVCPAQNLVVADRAGGLLRAILGRMPRRLRGDGRLPSPAADPTYGWDGLLPSEENPLVLAPADDLLVTANNDLQGAGYAGPLVSEYDLPARADRIRQRLLERPRWSAAELAGVQTDVLSVYAVAVVERLAGSYSGDAARAYGALAAWDGSMSARGPAALFALLERDLVRLVFADELDLARVSGQSRRIWLDRLLAGGMSPAWYDDVSTPEVEDGPTILARALAEAWREGSARWGGDVATWGYGDLHTLLLAHPLGPLPVLGRLVNLGPIPMPGSATTVAAFGGNFRGDRQPVTYGPSMRWISVVGAPDRSLAVLPAGQSGHPFDAHYSDQLPLYLNGEMRPVAFSETAIEASTVSRLTLVP